MSEFEPYEATRTSRDYPRLSARRFCVQASLMLQEIRCRDAAGEHRRDMARTLVGDDRWSGRDRALWLSAESIGRAVPPPSRSLSPCCEATCATSDVGCPVDIDS